VAVVKAGKYNGYIIYTNKGKIGKHVEYMIKMKEKV